jgi:hypothetical protein
MNSTAPLPAHRVDHAPSDVLKDCARQTVAQLHETANDPKLRIEPTQADDSSSPVWVVAIGTACLFAAMAAVMAFG